jgi:hypothetical protein
MADVAQEPAVEGQVASETSSVDQSGYLNDAFSGYLQDPNTDATDDESKNTENQAQTPKEEKPQVEKPKEDVKKEEEKKVDPFEKAFQNESGDFDIEKLMGISLDGLNFQSDEKPQESSRPEVKSNIPLWQQEYEAERTFKENVNKSRLGPIESAYTRIQQIQIPDEVKNIALSVLNEEYIKARDENEKFFREREQQNTFKARQEEQERLREEVRSAKLPELAKTNAMAIISKLPGGESKEKIDLYNRIMFGPDAGGELLRYLFADKYPDFNKKTPEEQNRVRLKFVNELQANGERLQAHFEWSKRFLTAHPENMKKIMSQVSRSAEANTKSNALAAQKKPDGSVNRQPKTGNSNWDKYFSNPKELKTRI